ncbi:protein kinase, partial [bacterium]|nr:protein kinase [bacterium]
MPNEDRDFGRAALGRNYITQQQAADGLKALAKMREMGLQESLGGVLIKLGFMNRAQVDAVTKALNQPRLTHIGRYRLIERVGQGGMGTVYKARQESLDKIVAIKVMSPRLARQKDFVERFIREAQACGRLNHPNIVLGIDAGEADGYYYFAMEFVDGESLKEVLVRDGKLSEKRALEITRAMAAALEHAHAQNIVHRDIKPGNIFLTAAGEPKLGDLGLAKEIQTDKSITQTGAPVGTPYYISPEQVRGEQHVDQRADLYALGATLYHMVAGVVPFDGPTGAVVMTRHLNEPIPDPRLQTHDLSDGILEIIHHAMAKAKTERYRNARHLREDIDNVLASQPPRHARKSKEHAAALGARVAGHRAQAEARKKLLVRCGIGAGAVAIIVLILLLVFRGGETPEPGVKKPPPVKAPPPKTVPKNLVKPPNTKNGKKPPAVPKVDPDALVAELIAAATIDSDPAATQKAFLAFSAAHKGTSASKKAKAHLSTLAAHWSAVAALKKQVADHVAAREYAAALTLISKPPLPQTSAQTKAMVEELDREVRRGAAEYVQAEAARADGLAGRGDLAEAKVAYLELAKLKLPAAVAASDKGLEAVAGLETARREREARRTFAASFLEATKLVAAGKLPGARKALDPAAAKAKPELAKLLTIAQGDLDKIDGLFKTIVTDLEKRAETGGQARIRGIMRPITSVDGHIVTCKIGRNESQFDVHVLTSTDIGLLECIKDSVSIPLLELYRGDIKAAGVGFAKLPKAEAAPYLERIRWVEAIGREGEAADLLAAARKLAGQKDWPGASQAVNRLLEAYGDTSAVDAHRAAINDLATRAAAAVADSQRRNETIRPFIDVADRCPALAKELAARKVTGAWVLDIDNDGRLDIALDLRRTVGDTPYVPVFRNATPFRTGALAFTEATRDVGLNTGDEPICWADLDGDGDLDVVCRGLWGAGRKSDHTKISLYENVGKSATPMYRCDPARSLEAALGSVGGFNGGFGNIAVLDANGDGRADVL